MQYGALRDIGNDKYKHQGKADTPYGIQLLFFIVPSLSIIPYPLLPMDLAAQQCTMITSNEQSGSG